MVETYNEDNNSDQNNNWFEDYEMNGSQDGDDYQTDARLELNKEKSLFEEPKLTKAASYNFIEDKEIEPKQKRMIDEIVDTLGVSEDIAKTLLLKYRWDKEEVINRYTDQENLMKKIFNYEIH